MLRCGVGGRGTSFTLRVVSPQDQQYGIPLDTATLESASIWGGSLRVVVDWGDSKHGWLVHGRVVKIQRAVRGWLERSRAHAAATRLQVRNDSWRFLKGVVYSDIFEMSPPVGSATSC